MSSQCIVVGLVLTSLLFCVFDFVFVRLLVLCPAILILCEYVHSQVDGEDLKKGKAAQYMRYYRGINTAKRCGDQLFTLVKAQSIHDYFDVP
jgi:hypothetical protein